MKTGIVIDKKLIEMNYYEIGLFLENKINEYINLSQKNKEEFEDFKKDYKFFKPYFDFAIFKLNYKILNPFFLENKIGYNKKGKFIVEDLFDGNIYEYSKTNDKEINVCYVNETSIDIGFISQDGLYFKVDRNKKQFHDDVLEQFLNQIIIYNKEICDDYYNNCIINHNYHNINSYFRDRLGFIQIGEKFILYNECLLNEKTKEIIKKIEEENHLIRDFSTLDKTKLNETKEIIDCIGDEHENRRF